MNQASGHNVMLTLRCSVEFDWQSEQQLLSESACKGVESHSLVTSQLIWVQPGSLFSRRSDKAQTPGPPPFRFKCV